MKFRYLSYILFLFPFVIFSQEISVSGTVLNSETKEPVSQANVAIIDSHLGTTTNTQGQFKIGIVSSAEFEIKFSHIGFESQTVKFNSSQVNVTIHLVPVVLSLGEMVVTSGKYEQKLKDLAAPLEIVSEENIKTNNYSTLSDALNSSPGLSISRDGTWATHINIRGLSKNNIVTLIDGNRIETGTEIAAGMSLIDVNDIERIEVIKSASSPLYGSGAIGGVVNIVSRKGFYRESFFINGSVNAAYNGVNNGLNENVFLNTGSNNWFIKFNSTFRNADNTKTGNGELENSQFKDNNFSADLGVKPFDDSEVLVKYQRFYAEDVGIPGGSPFAETALARYPEEKRELASAEFKLKNVTASLSNLSLKFSNQLIERRVEVKPNASAIVKPNADHKITSLQLQTEWNLGLKSSIISGIDIWNRNLNTWRTKEIIPKNQIIGETPVPNSDYRSIGFYMQSECNTLKDKIRINLGGRIDQIRVANDKSYNPEYIITNGVKNENPPNKQLLWDQKEADDISYSANAGIIYKLNKNSDLTFNISRSFRSPSLEERYQFIQLGSITYLGKADLEPESGTFLDVGFRIWRDEITFRANVFLNYLNNLVVDEFQNNQLYIKNNIGKARLYGFDASLNYKLYDHLTVYTAAAYVRGEDTGNDTNLPQIPPFNCNAGMDLTLLNSFSVVFEVLYNAQQNQVSMNEMKTGDYSLFNIKFKMEPIDIGQNSLLLAAGIENLFDRSYRNHLSTYRGLIKLEAGRNIFIKAGFQF